MGRRFLPALGALAFGAVLLALTLSLDVELQREVGGAIGPEAYPGLLALLIIGLALVLLVRAARGAPDEGVDEGALAGEVLAEGPPNRRGVALTLGLLCLYTLLLPSVGYLLATPPALVALMLLTGERRWLLMVAGALVLTVALYLFFRHGMSLVLPEGLLGERLPR